MKELDDITKVQKEHLDLKLEDQSTNSQTQSNTLLGELYNQQDQVIIESNRSEYGLNKFGGFGGLDGEKIKDKVTKGEALKLSKVSDVKESNSDITKDDKINSQNSGFDAQAKLDALKNSFKNQQNKLNEEKKLDNPKFNQEISVTDISDKFTTPYNQSNLQHDQEDYEDDMQLLNELYKDNKAEPITAEDVESQNTPMRNYMIESQETRKMNVSHSYSNPQSVNRYSNLNEDGDYKGQIQVKGSQVSFGEPQNKQNFYLSGVDEPPAKDAKLPKPNSGTNNQYPAMLEKIASLAKQNKSLDERIDLMLKEKQKNDETTSQFLKEISLLNKKIM